MADTKTYTENEAHQFFARSINGRVWELLQKSDRSAAEDDEMLYAAHACTYHWLVAGTPVHQQRGEWLISRVHVVLGHPQEALHHAKRCFQLTEAHRASMSDFDVAYAHEGLARALALSGQIEKAQEHHRVAGQLGDAIQDEEDKSVYWGDLQGGDWFGLLD